jgi:Zn-dependent alcohol dehydrogenase
MRQAVITAPDRFEVVSVPVPRLESDEDILIRTASCGICSGDLMKWYLEKKVGTVFGHEPAGWAVAVGDRVKHVRPGDLVFVHHHAPCLRCADCARQPRSLPHLARARSTPAAWRSTSASQRRTCADTFAVNDLTPEQAVFIEPLGCCVKALTRLPLLRGTDGVVVGCGIMGLLNLAAAKAAGRRSRRGRTGRGARAGPSTRAPPRRDARGGRPHAEARRGLRGDWPGFPDVIRQAAGVRAAGRDGVAVHADRVRRADVAGPGRDCTSAK